MSTLPRTVLEATIDGFTHGGEGVARIDGKAVFVPGALPGEVVRLQVATDRKRWARAELVEVVEASEHRVEPPCPHAHACGGCDLQHVDAAGQLVLKTRVVREQLERIGHLDDPPVRECVTVGPQLGYRTVARMHAGDDGRLGFHRAGTNDVVPIDVCPVLTDATQSVRADTGDATGAAEVTVRATSTGHRAVVLAPGPGPLDLQSIPDDVDVGLAQPDGSLVPARGDGTVTEHVAGLDFDVAAGSFFQGNSAGAATLVDAVLDEVDPGMGLDGAIVWDLYAGVGLFSLPLARAGARVTAVELDAVAVEHLVANAQRAGLDHLVEAGADDVGDFVARPQVDAPDVVVLDPPRTGAGRDIVAAIAGFAPGRIVYVACDPAAFARDARILADHGYRLHDARPFDLFPMTHHVEVVARFTP